MLSEQLSFILLDAPRKPTCCTDNTAHPSAELRGLQPRDGI